LQPLCRSGITGTGQKIDVMEDSNLYDVTDW
jgi:hypothetical protein